VNATISEPMARDKQPPKSSKSQQGRKTPKYPSRDKIKYAGIPEEYWDALEAMGKEEDGPFHKRSCAYLVTLAVRRFLTEQKRLPPKPAPPPEADGK
jgi:hypothetical protein